MQTIQSFTHPDFGSLEAITLGGKPYFPATECAALLGYKNPHKAVRDHCKGVTDSFTPTQNQHGATVMQTKNFIPEGDLYRLIIRSKLPAAVRFEAWVCDEVLPALRQHGFYVTQTPQGWNAGIFTMVRNLSETVILPIAGIILTFVLCYELIQLIIEKNNMHDFDTFNIFKWIGKSFVAVLILTNTWNIVMGIFDLAQGVVNQSAGLITGDLTLGSPEMLLAIAAQLETLGTGELLVLFLQVQVVGLLMEIMAIVITIIVWGRMIEIYLVTSIAPIPLATMVNREWGQMGNNYLKSLLALGFQGFLIMICLAIYAVLVANFVLVGSMTTTIWSIVAYTALLCFMLLKSGGIAKSVFNSS